MRPFMILTKALADENRVRTLMFLRYGELCLCQIIEMLGLAPSTVSKHMSILRQAGLVEFRKDGRWTYYRLADRDAPQSVRRAIRWIQRVLAGDKQIAGDTKRLKTVLKMDTEQLCKRYRS